VDGDGDGLHEAELGWSEFNWCPFKKKNLMGA
jgi:hypothetical protein